MATKYSTDSPPAPQTPEATRAGLRQFLEGA
jgi:hypothetical protein